MFSSILHKSKVSSFKAGSLVKLSGIIALNLVSDLLAEYNTRVEHPLV